MCLELQHKIHVGFAERVDLVENEGDNNINAVGFVSGDRILK